MSYGIGLDIGIASVGWAIVDLDQNENPMGIIDLGARIFDAAENPKDGASLALPRREARSARRRLRRHRHRMERIKRLLVSSGIISDVDLEHLFDGQLQDIYELRAKALDYSVTNKEMARILLHLAQRRGFKSNRKAENSSKENGELLTAVSANTERMREKHYRTIGEMFYKDEVFATYKRNKGENYLSTVQRDMVEAEVHKIFDVQRTLGNNQFTKEFEDAYKGILLSQRAFDEGPGGNSPYGGNQIENMIGICTFENVRQGKEKNEQRAAKSTFTFEYFNLLQKVNHLRLVVDGKNIPLDDEQRGIIIKLAKTKADLKYSAVRKALGIADNILFAGLNYADNDVVEYEKKQKFDVMKYYHQMRKALDKVEKGRIAKYNPEQLDAIATILTKFKGDDRRRECFAAIGIDTKDVDQLLDITGVSKFGHLSIKALSKIIPYMEKGALYNEACEAAGYDFRAHAGGTKDKLLPAYMEEMDDITSPVARRAISQTIKVINAIIRKQGESPIYINVELAREMSKNFKERGEITKKNEENRAANERLMEEIKTNFGVDNPTGLDLVKYKLYKEQDGITPYSQQALDLSRLFEPGYVDVDHIVPYSISFDDGYVNKVLVLSSENREKGNRLPLVYLQEKFGQQAADNFEVWVTNNVKNYRKRQKLLKKAITEEDINKFKERNLTDTKTIARFMLNYIRDYLEFAPSLTDKKKRVTAVNGAVTAYMRKRWGIAKVRADGDRHHAVDALVIACTTDKMIMEASWYSNIQETETNRELLQQKFPLPYSDFSRELSARLAPNPVAALTQQNLLYYIDKDLNDYKPIFISRMPRHKVTGAAHLETIRGVKMLDEGCTVAKVELTALKLNKDGEIDGYYNPSSDLILYNALKARLQQFDNDAKKAFAEPFYKPKSDGTPGHLVKKVKVFKKSTLNVAVHKGNGVADNGDVIRLDVYHIADDGYYFVPIYVANTIKDLPNRAVVNGKSYKQWKLMKPEDFIFSLYPNDLIHVVSRNEISMSRVCAESTLPEKKECKEEWLYVQQGFAGTTVTVINNDNTYIVKSLGLRKLQLLEKYQVDVLGNYVKVEKETRQKFK